MNGRTNHPHGRKPQPAHWLWGCWVMLLVVLLSAAPTGAQPRTRLVGSAFDPSTISVAVSPKPLKADPWLKKARGKRPGEGTPGVARKLFLIAASIVVARQVPVTTGSLAGTVRRFDLPVGVPVRSRLTRAPPLG